MQIDSWFSWLNLTVTVQLWAPCVAQLCPTLCHSMDCSLPGSSVHGISQASNTGVGCNFLLQGIFLTQKSNPCLNVSCIGPISLHNLKLKDYYLGWKQKESFLCQFMTLVAEILISLRNALEGFGKADGTLDSQVMSFHNLVHSFLNGTSALPHSAANDPVFVVCSKTQIGWKMF